MALQSLSSYTQAFRIYFGSNLNTLSSSLSHTDPGQLGEYVDTIEKQASSHSFIFPVWDGCRYPWPRLCSVGTMSTVPGMSHAPLSE